MSIKDFPQANSGVARTGSRAHEMESRTVGGGGFPSPNGGAALEGRDVGVAAPAAMPALQVFPWWYYPASGSQYFYRDTRPNQVVAAGAQNQLLTDSELVIGRGQRGVIVGIALTVQAPTIADDFFYTLLRNNAPVSGLDRLRNFAVVANAAVRDFNGYSLQLEPADQMSWTVTNNGAAAVTVGVSYFGWQTMVTEIDRIQKGANY
jgi:hypothetical protein